MAKIIIVDDSLIMRKMLSTILTGNGHEILATGQDGDEAIQLFSKHKPDLMLLDLTMPNKGGREALGEIMAEFANAKVVIFSSITDEKTVNECKKLGAKDFVNKDLNFLNPEKRDVLLGTINRALGD